MKIRLLAYIVCLSILISVSNMNSVFAVSKTTDSKESSNFESRKQTNKTKEGDDASNKIASNEVAITQDTVETENASKNLEDETASNQERINSNNDEHFDKNNTKNSYSGNQKNEADKSTLNEKSNDQIDSHTRKTKFEGQTNPVGLRNMMSDWQAAEQDFVSVSGKFNVKIPQTNSKVSDSGKSVLITPDMANQIGAVWSYQKLDMTQNWATEMQMILGYSEYKGNNSGDGMAFVLHNDPRGIKAKGERGHTLGVYGWASSFGDYVRNGWVVEFDTYVNIKDRFEPDNFDGLYFGPGTSGPHKPDNRGHVANSYSQIDSDDNPYMVGFPNLRMKHNNLQYKLTGEGQLNNGKIKTFKVSWNAPKEEITYEFEDFGAVTKKIDFSKLGYSKELYWGFTGSTGFRHAPQLVGFKSIPQTMNVKPKKQTIFLGGKVNTGASNIDNLIEIISGDGIEIASIVENYNSNLVGKGHLELNLRDKYGNLMKTTVPVEVKWGETIELRGAYSSNVMGLTLQNQLDGSIKLTSSRGIKKGKGRISPDDYSVYIDISVYRVKDQISGSSNLEEYYNFSVTGQEYLDQAYKQMETQLVKPGDIIRIRHKQFKRYPHLILLHHQDNERVVNKDEDMINNEAFFEITSFGYERIYFNQLTTKKVSVKNGASHEEQNQKLQESIDLKGHTNITIECFKEQLPNTQKDGEQKINVMVSEILHSGKKVEYTYTVTFVVNPVVTENIYSSDGELLQTKQTELSFKVDSFSPNPKNRLELDGIKYKYEGWLSSHQKPVENAPQNGKINTVKETTTFHYVYSDLNKMIHVTVPLEMIFSSSNTETQDIQSNLYRVENHSEEARLNIKLASFETKENAGIQLLAPSGPDPGLSTEAIRLHLLVDGTEKINSLNETSKMLEIGTLNPKATWMMQFGGTYFGKITEDKKITNHSMVLKFSANF
ncbi:lectin-like domain-containing protein [Bacillus mycoides]|uniref:L-type lectin-domain containing protein n=1 Tax=Bacillus mycoides TaxID=1405 RepID=UPI003D6479A7